MQGIVYLTPSWIPDDGFRLKKVGRGRSNIAYGAFLDHVVDSCDLLSIKLPRAMDIQVTDKRLIIRSRISTTLSCATALGFNRRFVVGDDKTVVAI